MKNIDCIYCGHGLSKTVSAEYNRDDNITISFNLKCLNCGYMSPSVRIDLHEDEDRVEHMKKLVATARGGETTLGQFAKLVRNRLVLWLDSQHDVYIDHDSIHDKMSDILEELKLSSAYDPQTISAGSNHTVKIIDAQTGNEQTVLEIKKKLSWEAEED
jgi:hypothetical protein